MIIPSSARIKKLIPISETANLSQIECSLQKGSFILSSKRDLLEVPSKLTNLMLSVSSELAKPYVTPKFISNKY
jgi:hypothetical protein